MDTLFRNPVVRGYIWLCSVLALQDPQKTARALRHAKQRNGRTVPGHYWALASVWGTAFLPLILACGIIATSQQASASDLVSHIGVASVLTVCAGLAYSIVRVYASKDDFSAVADRRREKVQFAVPFVASGVIVAVWIWHNILGR